MLRAAMRVLAGLLALASAARAQDWPTRPVTMMVPFAAGGALDVVARIVAPRMSEILGQQVVVENASGAGGMTGASRVAKAVPDGYQFLYGNQGTHTFSQLLSKKPLYNAVADFAPVIMFVENSKVLITRKDLPVDTLAEFIAYAKTNQDKMQYGSAGAGSATHVTCVLFNSAIGVNITHVPYRSTALAMQDMMASRIDFICDVISTALPHVRGNSVKAIALLSPNRSPVLPDLATAHEQGLANFDADAWNAFFLPKGTHQAIIRRLARTTSETVDTPSVRARLEELGLTVPPAERRTFEYLAQLLPRELEKWGAAFRAAGISPE